MRVSKPFLRDFAYLANLYGWSAADVEDAKAQTRTSPAEMVRYWTQLATAHRAGYQQTAENNYMRLEQWVQLHGTADPERSARVREGFRTRCAHAREGGQ